MTIVLAIFLIFIGYSSELCQEMSQSLDIAVMNDLITEQQAESFMRNCLRKAGKQAG